MGSSKKQIIASIRKSMTEMEGIEIRNIEIDGEKIGGLVMDGGEPGLTNMDGNWFFPLSALTVSELKTVKTMMNKVKELGL